MAHKLHEHWLLGVRYGIDYDYAIVDVEFSDLFNVHWVLSEDKYHIKVKREEYEERVKGIKPRQFFDCV